jgi:chromosomal replication initiator protein
MTAQQLWEAALGQLELRMTKPTFNTWIKPTSALTYEDGTLIISVPNAYTKDWLENRLLPVIKRTLADIAYQTIEVRFTLHQSHQAPGASGLFSSDGLRPPVAEHSALYTVPQATALPPGDEQRPTPMFNERYTFDTFVVGHGNRLAHAASLAVAEAPARAYNPLFIYGGVGLGKTHLLHGIGQSCQSHGYSVLYVSSETFTNHLINSIRGQSTEQFREKYRHTDVLLVDDIQFIAGKESTQEEFFHTFNTLHEAHKQIILSSDRPPKALITLEGRLRSRFEWGLIADIQPPDLETRIAILRFKAEQHHLPIPEEVIDFIARHIRSNIRELEGALNRVVATARLMRQPLTTETAHQTLRDFVPQPARLTIPQVMEITAQFYRLALEDLTGRRRTKEIALARHVAMYLARELTEASLPRLGKAFGGRDHTTVLHGCARIAENLEQDEELRYDLLRLKERLLTDRPSPRPQPERVPASL